jgi:hypothetical protein
MELRHLLFELGNSAIIDYDVISDRKPFSAARLSSKYFSG